MDPQDRERIYGSFDVDPSASKWSKVGFGWIPIAVLALIVIALITS
jgi:hypothetical protein